MKPRMKPEDLYCFPQVVKAIGKKRARVELQKVIDKGLVNHTGEAPLIGAFTWGKTPQGDDFWVRIENHKGLSYRAKKLIKILVVIALAGVGVAYFYFRSVYG